MLFHSLNFIAYFVVIFVVYYTILWMTGKRSRVRVDNFFLLAVSYWLYVRWDPVWTLYLLGVTAVTYLGARAIDGKPRGRRRLITSMAFFIIAFTPLAIFKYSEPLNNQLNNALAAFNIGTGLPGLNWAIPVGLSFYTFQATGYLFDVYHRRIAAERDWWSYMLFVSFFPYITSGPICRYAELMPQIKTRRQFDYDRAVEGCRCLLWGFFLKLVLADPLGDIATGVFAHFGACAGASCFIAIFCYSLEIYGDFAGYSLIAIGIGKLMGFNLPGNFRRPYLADTFTEFWRRWHISLTRWLVANVYIPLGGSRCSAAKRTRNIIITFIVSGLWHGGHWPFIVWGLAHGCLMSAEKALGLDKSVPHPLRWLRILAVFVVVSLLWVCFKVDTLSLGLQFIGHVFNNWGNPADDLNHVSIALIVAPIVIVFVKEWFNEYHPEVSLMHNRRQWVRTLTYIGLAATILLYGGFDDSSFIYAMF